MSVSNQVVKQDYIGNGVTTSFPIPFAYLRTSQIKVSAIDNVTGVVTSWVLTTDYTMSPAINPTSIEAVIAPAVGVTLRVYRLTPLVQDTSIENSGEFLEDELEKALDKEVMQLQEVAEVLNHTLRFSPKDESISGLIPPLAAGNVLAVNPAATAIEFITPADLKGEQGVTGDTGQFDGFSVVGELEYDDAAPMSVANVGSPTNAILEFILRKGPVGPKGESTVLITNSDQLPNDAIGTDGDMWFVFSLDANNGNVYQRFGGIYVLQGTILGPAGGITDIDLTVGSYLTTYDGFSARFGAQFTSTSLKDTLDKIIQITYTPPQISLGGSSNILREKGDTVSSITLTASVTKKSDPIAEVRFYQGATLLGTKTGTIPTGGSEAQGYATPFSDNITFSAKVDDNGATGGPTTVTANASYTFIYPYYNGAGASGKSAAQVAALSKSIINSTATLAKTMSAAASDVFYFAYPASYGALSSILDVNNFETIGDWTLTTSNITGLNATAVSYRIYEFKNPVTAGSYQYTFKR